MHSFRIYTATAAMVLSIAAFAQNGPTMGWSSWNTYKVNISEELIKSQADAIVSTGLSEAGFNHINIDDGFFGGRDTATGELLINPSRFPHGLKPVADYIHSKGLKAGIYSDAGASTCGNYYNNDTLSVGVGFLNYDQRDADFYFKECGFDFIKVDFCGGNPSGNFQRMQLDPKERYTAIARAIRNTGRTDVRLNVCRWDYPGTWVHDVAFSWRTTSDISNRWSSVKSILASNLYLSAYAYDGHYNDMDMLEVGRSMTADEDRTHFGMWCIMDSPLLIGCDLTTIKPETLALLKNTELTALNQDPLCQQAYLVSCKDGCYVLVKDIEKLGGTRRAFAVYNPEDEDKTVRVDFSELDLAGKVSLRDVFERQDLGEFSGGIQVSVPAHGTRIYVASARRRTDRVRYEAETAYISDYQEIKNNQSERTGIYEQDPSCSSGYKATWLGWKEENDLVWRDVLRRRGGKSTVIVACLTDEARDMTLSVNGKAVGTKKVGPDDRTVTFEVKLEKGRNELRLSNPSSRMPDIDYMEIR